MEHIDRINIVDIFSLTKLLFFLQLLAHNIISKAINIEYNCPSPANNQ